MDLQDELSVLENVEELQLLTVNQLQRKTEIQTELMKIYELEEQYWNERENSDWLLKGDGNTEYFHSIANGKKERKTQSTLSKVKIG